MNTFSPQIPSPPLAGQRTLLQPGIWWVRMPLPFALDHINLWLLEGDAGYTLVDTGMALPAVKAAWDTILAGLDKPLTDIVVTHFHPDHLGLAQWLIERTGASMHLSVAEYLTAHMIWHQQAGHSNADMLQFFAAHGLAKEAQQVLAERGNAYRKGVPDIPLKYRRLHAGDIGRFGATDWRLDLGQGHSPEHIALYSEKSSVLISGDMLLPRITTNISVFSSAPEEDELARYLASLAAWQSLPDSVLILPSHGLPFFGAKARISYINEHHAERLRTLESACGKMLCAAELLPTLFPRPLDAHQTMFAMGEAIAHLNHLYQANRLTRQVGTDGVFRFQRSTFH